MRIAAIAVLFLAASAGAQQPAQDDFVVAVSAAQQAIDAGDGVAARQQIYEALRLAKKRDDVPPKLEASLWDGLVEAARLEQDVTRGNRAVTDAVEFREKAHGKRSPEVVPGLLQQAQWYMYSSQTQRMEKPLQRAVDILAEAHGEQSVELYVPLAMLARSYLAGYRKPDAARRALRQALALELPDDGMGHYLRSQGNMLLGDVEVVFADGADSGDFYASAWQSMNRYYEGDAARTNEEFDEPEQLFYRMPRSPARSRYQYEYFGEGFVLLQFTVNERGQVVDERVVESQPGTDFDGPALSSIARARYRPRIVDAVPLATPGVQQRNTYDIKR